LAAWIDDALMLKIANENNLAETAYFVRKSPGTYALRWFTPEGEVELCGHATLASAWLLFEQLDTELKSVAFETRSGVLTVERGRDGYHQMSLPSDRLASFDAPEGFAARIGEALGTSQPIEVLKGRYLFAVWREPHEVRRIRGAGDIARILRSI